MEQANPKYRRIFETNSFLTVDRVDSPWINVPDQSNYNRRAFRVVQAELHVLVDQARSGTNPTSRGVLILGEAGTGKTHLLMRIARNLGKDAPLLFIRRPTNETAVAQHIWENMVDSLRHPAHSDVGPTVSQLDRLLNRIFVQILGRIWQKDASGEAKQDAKQRLWQELDSGSRLLRESLGKGETRQKNLNHLRSSLLNYIQRAMPEVDIAIAKALITYCLVTDESYKRSLLNWLTFHELSEQEASTALLQKSPVIDDGSQSQASIQQAREKFALKCIQTLGELSVLHSPLILAFDQLEGLRNSATLTASWGDVVRELFTMAPNYLVLTCVFPSIWNEWFSQQLQESAAQRIAQSREELEKFDASHAEQLLAAHLNTLFSQERLPHAIYPFTPKSVDRICQNATSVRTFLQAARQALRNWIFDQDDCSSSSEHSCEPIEALTQDCISKAIGDFFREAEKQHFNEYSSQTPSEQASFGKVSELATCLLRPYSPSRSQLDCGNRVLPAHLVLQSAGTGRSVVFAVCNAPSTSFTARVKNLLNAANQLKSECRVIVVRDARLDQYTPTMTQEISRLDEKGHAFIELQREEFSQIMALHDCLVAAEEGALQANSVSLDVEKLEPYLRDRASDYENGVLDLLLAGLLPESESIAEQSMRQSTTEIAETTGDSVDHKSVADHGPTPAAEKEIESGKEAEVIEPPEVSPPESRTNLDEESERLESKAAQVELGQEIPGGSSKNWEVSIRSNPHLMIVGLPGMGKTTSIVNICKQLAAQRIRPIVFSYHEDLDELLSTRIENLAEINHQSLGFNPLALNSDGPRAHVENAGMIRDIFCGIFPELGEIQSDMIRRAVKQSHELSAAAGAEPRFRDFFQILRAEEKPDRGLLARLEELSDFGLFDSTSETESLLEADCPLLISLHGTKNEVVQRAFASLLLYRLYQEMFIRGVQNRITHAIVFDEAHRASKLGLLATMAKESRKFGISMVLASQEARDFSPSMFSAIGNYLVLRVIDKDARALARNVASGNATKSTTDMMKQLPKYEAVFANGGSFNRLRLRSIDGDKTPVSFTLQTSTSSYPTPTGR